MKNKITDLNNHLFEQLERLNDDSLTDEQLEKEIMRGKAVADIAKTIIASGNLALQAKKHLDEYGQGDKISVPLLGIKDEQAKG